METLSSSFFKSKYRASSSADTASGISCNHKNVKQAAITNTHSSEDKEGDDNKWGHNNGETSIDGWDRLPSYYITHEFPLWS